MFHAPVEHFVKSLRYYRLTALYLIAGIVLVTAHVPFAQRNLLQEETENRNSATSDAPNLWRFQLDIGEPPVSIGHIAYYVIAGWISFLGAFWDVRRRMKEWAIIRLYGGYPSLVAGFHFFCLSLLGASIGGGFALLTRLPHSLTDVCWRMAATLVWGFFAAGIVSIGPVLYTEFCDVVAGLRIEGEAR